MKGVCTICSRSKREDAGLLPARERYTAPHISAAGEIAKKAGLPFFILSGKYGLLGAEEEIPNYDYYLEPSAVGPLAATIGEQLKKHGITELDFYMEQKPTWAPYYEALTQGAKLAGVSVKACSL